MPTSEDIGRIVWHDLMTNDVAGAMRFYGDLLGWKYRIEHASNCAWTGAKADYPLTIANGQAHGGFVNPGGTDALKSGPRKPL